MDKRVSRRWRSVLASGALAVLVAPAGAEIIATEQVMLRERIEVERERIRSVVDREGVEQRMKALGVAPETARERVDALTDAEILTIAGKLDTLPAGGALDKTDWLLVLLLVILLLVAL